MAMNEYQLIINSLSRCTDINSIDNFVRDGLNYDLLITMLGNRSLASVIYDKISIYSISDDAKNRFKNIIHTSLKRHSFLKGELIKIINLFEDHGIDFLLLKGFVLDTLIYKDRGWVRDFVDLDLLVRPRNIEKAARLLLDNRYLLTHTKVPLRYERKLRYHYPFSKPHLEENVYVELHTNLYPVYSPFTVDVEDLFSSASHILLDEKKIPTLSIEEELIYLCTHFLFIHGDRLELKYLFEIAQLSEKSLNWNVLVERAREEKAASFVYYSLRLAINQLGASIPLESLEMLETGSSYWQLFWFKKLFRDSELGKEKKANSPRKQWLIRTLFAKSMRTRILGLLDLYATQRNIDRHGK